MVSPLRRVPIFFATTPNLDINIDRDRASIYGVSTTKLAKPAARRLFAELRLPDQGAGRPIPGHPRSRRQGRERARKIFAQIYVKPDNGNTLIPIRAVTKSTARLGLQSVNHMNQFTSVTFGFDTKPGVALGDVTDFIQKTAAEVLPPTVKGELQGEGLVLQQLFQALPFLVIAAVFVMYVILGILYESYVHPITVLSTLFPAVVGG